MDFVRSVYVRYDYIRITSRGVCSLCTFSCTATTGTIRFTVLRNVKSCDVQKRVRASVTVWTSFGTPLWFVRDDTKQNNQNRKLATSGRRACDDNANRRSPSFAWIRSGSSVRRFRAENILSMAGFSDVRFVIFQSPVDVHVLSDAYTPSLLFSFHSLWTAKN